MSPTPPPRSVGDPSTRTVGDALIAIVDDFDPGELLAAITPKRLGEAVGYSPSSMRYQLGGLRAAHAAEGETPGSVWGFDRDFLMLVMADALFDRLIETSNASLAGYRAVFAEIRRTGDLRPLGRALVDDMEAFTPGGTAHDTGGGADRARLLAITAAEGDPKLSRLLRDRYEQWLATYEPAYAELLAFTGRRLLPGMTIADVASPVSMFLQGLSARRRFDPRYDPDAVLRGFLGIVFAWTEPAGPAAVPLDAYLGGAKAAD